MAEHSHIQWTEATWNPWYGCLKVSCGCKFCYMYREMKQYGRNPAIVQRSKTKFDEPLKWQKKLAVGHPAPRLVFTCSWSDFFIKQADAWRAEAWDIIRRCPDIIFLILTKRPERIAECLPPHWLPGGWDNVALGVSCEDQETADRRIPQLLRVQAHWHFVSLEPMLGPITLTELPYASCHEPVGDEEAVSLRSALEPSFVESQEYARLDWVIAGGESGGEEARPIRSPQWFRHLRDQCQHASVPFFLKQWGEYAPVEGENVMRRVGREKAGALLDGVAWQQMPDFSERRVTA